MNGFLKGQMDYILFLYGLSFFILAVICFLFHRFEREKTSNLPWSLLGMFALLHGLNEWLDMFAIIFQDNQPFSIVRLIVLSMSFLFLFEFGRRARFNLAGKTPGTWIYVLLLIPAVSGLIYGIDGMNTTVHYFLALTAGFFSSHAVYRASKGETQQYHLPLFILSIAMCCYAIAEGLIVLKSDLIPARWINYDSFNDYFGFPVQVLLTALALLQTIAIWIYSMHVLKTEAWAQKYALRRGLIGWTLAVLLLLGIVSGWIITDYIGESKRKDFEKNTQSLSTLLLNHLNDKFLTVDHSVSALSGSPWVTPALQSKIAQDREKANSVLDRYKHSMDVSVCYLLDKSGITIASSNRNEPDSFVGKSYSFRPYFQQAIAGMKGNYFALGITSKERGYYASSPVKDRQGNIIGAAVIKVNIIFFESAFKSYPYAFVVSPEGIIFISSRPDFLFKSLWPPDEKSRSELLSSLQFGNVSFEAVLQKEPINDSYITYNGNNFYVLRLPLRQAGWSLVFLNTTKDIAYSRLFGIFLSFAACFFIMVFSVILIETESQRESSLKLLNLKEEILESKEKYHLLFSHEKDAIILIDSETNRFIDANEACLELYGYSREEFMNMSPADISAEPDKTDSALKEASTTGKILIPLRWHRKKDGTLFPVEITGSSFIMKNRPVIYSIIRDITERKKFEEELLKARKLESLGVLAGGIAHDFNNLLSVILGNIEMSKMFTPPDSKVMKALTEALNACKHATDLSARLITFSSGGEPHKEVTSISKIIKEAAIPLVKDSNVTCEFSLPEGLSSVEVDERQIRQVIISLITNAKEAMPDGGNIKIQEANVTVTEKNGIPLKEGNYVKISIQDQGVGIPEEYLSEIFDPYFSTKDTYYQKGMGLGLSICYSLLKRHDGLITVKSKVGIGSTFHIYLPAFEKK